MDEQNCAFQECSSSEFQCHYGECISLSLRCDGDHDCRDHSDEENCTFAKPHRCVPGEMVCPISKECLLKEWLCDGDVDCEDGTDEKNCQFDKVTCSPLQWRCASEDQCIPEFWHCDGERDCRDSSDESACVKIPKCQSYEFQCGSLECIDTGLVCNEQSDCADGSDEGGKCSSSACESSCSHQCYRTPHGSRCACKRGFQLSNGHLCEDIDECKDLRHKPCSQTCFNKNGTYSCACHPGYLLESDGHRCKVTGEEPILLASVQYDLMLYGLRSFSKSVLPVTGKNMIFSIDYDWKDQKVFWVDLNAESIKWMNLAHKEKGTLVKGIKSDCIAVDWIGRNLYWTDGVASQILAINLNAVWSGTQEYTVVVDEDIDQPSSLVLQPLNGLMYWAEIGEPQIKRASMDGTSRKVLIDEGLGWPVSLTLDLLSWKIFWADEKFHGIGVANLDGTNVKLVQLMETPSPFSVAVLEDEIYWSDTKTRSIQKANKNTGKQRNVLIKRHGQPYGLKVSMCVFLSGYFKRAQL
nr:PREDICTED: low-density lipoprotein receptor-like [Latimeria chalumnae]|eukprot:XP_014354113.1 PREDICTED: low-density lipoprotein receptor-like [Latimeria chalumnae]